MVTRASASVSRPTQFTPAHPSELRPTDSDRIINHLSPARLSMILVNCCASIFRLSVLLLIHA